MFILQQRNPPPRHITELAISYSNPVRDINFMMAVDGFALNMKD